MDNEHEFDGKGDSTQSNRLEGDITVTVAQRLPNGNLLVRGQKWIAINQGKEYVRMQGIVRPIDIDPDNIDLVAGGGRRDDRLRRQGHAWPNASKPGWLFRFFNLAAEPF